MRRTPASPRQRAVIDAFFAAARAGDLSALVELLDPDVVLRTDGAAGRPRVLRGPPTRAPAWRGRRPQRNSLRAHVNGAAGALITLAAARPR